MSKNVKFVLDIKGLNELMKSEWFQGVLNETAEGVVSRAEAQGLSASYRTHLGSFTAITNVYPDDEESIKKNLQDNSLAIALYGGE